MRTSFVIAALVALVLALGGGVYWWFAAREAPPESAAAIRSGTTAPAVSRNANAELPADTVPAQTDDETAPVRPLSPELTPAAGDSDGDGLQDEHEVLYGTNPTNPDTDGDGFPDGDEIERFFSPLGSGRVPMELMKAYCRSGSVVAGGSDALTAEDLDAVCEAAGRLYGPLLAASDAQDAAAVDSVLAGLSAGIATQCDALFDAGSSENFSCSILLMLLFTPLQSAV